MKSFCRLFVFLTVLFYQSSSAFSVDEYDLWEKQSGDDVDLDELFGEIAEDVYYVPGLSCEPDGGSEVTPLRPPAGAFEVPAPMMPVSGQGCEAGGAIVLPSRAERVSAPSREQESLSLNDRLDAALFCDSPNLILVGRLLEAGASPDLRNRKKRELKSGSLPADYHALGFAAMTGNVALLELLLENGADVNLTTLTTGQFPALSLAIKNLKDPESALKIVEMLLAHGADVDIRSRNGMRPLEYSVKRGDPFFVFFLLKQGAKVGPLTVLLNIVFRANFLNEDSRLLVVRLLVDGDALLNCDELPSDEERKDFDRHSLLSRAIEGGIDVGTLDGLISIMFSFCSHSRPLRLILLEHLELAIDMNNPAVLRVLLNRLFYLSNTKFKTLGAEGSWLLYRALVKGDLELFKAMLESSFSFDLGRLYAGSQSIVDLAFERGLVDVGNYLLSYRKYQIESFAYPKIRLAIAENDMGRLYQMLSYLKSLCGEGVLPGDHFCVDGFLLHALRMRNLYALNMLFEMGFVADINKGYKDGKTLLHFAYEYRFLDLAAYLIECGASQRVLDSFGVVPLWYYSGLQSSETNSHNR